MSGKGKRQEKSRLWKRLGDICNKIFGMDTPAPLQLPPAIKTIEQIQEDLTSSGGIWIALSGYHVLIAADVNSDGVKFNMNAGVVVKTFVNLQTGEVKTFAARNLVVPERDFLFRTP